MTRARKPNRHTTRSDTAIQPNYKIQKVDETMRPSICVRVTGCHLNHRIELTIRNASAISAMEDNICTDVSQPFARLWDFFLIQWLAEISN